MIKINDTTLHLDLIVAIGNDGLIGRDGDLPWRCDKDLAWFKRKTTNTACVVGYTTYQSIKHLKNRHFIVLTSNPTKVNYPSIGVSTLTEAYEQAYLKIKELQLIPRIMIIGGKSVYLQALDRGDVDTLFITHITNECTGDTYLPMDKYAPKYACVHSESLSDIATLTIWNH